MISFQINREDYPFIFSLGVNAHECSYAILKLELYDEKIKEYNSIKRIAVILEKAEIGMEKNKLYECNGRYAKHIEIYSIIFKLLIEYLNTLEVNILHAEIIDLKQHFYFLYNQINNHLFHQVPNEKMKKIKDFLNFLDIFARNHKLCIYHI